MGLALGVGVPFIASLLGGARIPADLFLETVPPAYFFDGDQHWIASEGPELVNNGTFDTNTTGWSGVSANLSSVGGALRATSTLTGAGATASFQDINTTAGKLYEARATYVATSGGGTPNAQLEIRATNGSLSSIAVSTVATPSNGTVLSVYFTAIDSTTRVRVRNDYSASVSGVSYVDWDNVSVREVRLGELGANLGASGYTMGTTGGTSTATESPTGQLNLTGDGTFAAYGTKQITGLTIGRHYRVIALISTNAVSGSVGTSAIGNQTVANTVLDTGVKQLEFTATATTHWVTFIRTSVGTASVSSITVAEWTPAPTVRPATFRDCFDFTCGSDTTRTYVDMVGMLRTMAYGRTNLFNYSQDFPTGWALTNGGNTVTVASNVAVAPDGSLTADRITSGAGAGANDVAQTVSATGLITLSAYFKAEAPGTIVHIRTSDLVTGGTHVNLNLDTLAFSILTYQQGTTTEAAASVQAVGNGWVRLVLTQKFNSGTSVGCGFGISPNMTFESGAVASGTTVLVWGAQFEFGNQVTDYKATGATNRRGGIDAPRYTWNPSRQKMDLVLENQTTNIRTNGQSPVFTFPIGGVTRTTGQPDPMGTNEAVRLDYAAGAYTADHDINVVTSIANRRWTRAIWMRADTPCVIAFRIASIGGLANTVRVVQVTTAWQRFEHLSILFDGSRTETALTIGLDNRTLFGSDQAAKTIYAFGDQVEEYAYSTSTILTPGSAVVTRLIESDVIGSRLRALHELLPALTTRTQVRLLGAQPGSKRVKGTSGSAAATFMATNAIENQAALWNGAVDLPAIAASGSWLNGASATLAFSSQGRSICFNGGTVASDANLVSRVPPYYLGRDNSTVSGIVPIFGDGSYFQDALWPFRGANASLPAATPIPAGVPVNLIPKSEAFDDAGWTKNSLTVTANAAANPLRGELTADRAVLAAASSAKGLDHPAFTSGVAQPYTFSVYAKADPHAFIQLRTNTVFGTQFANFDLATGVLGTKSAGAVNHTITHLGGGWYRCSCTITPNSSVSGFFVVAFAPTASSARAPVFTSSGTDAVLLYGAQLEVGTTLGYYAANL